MRNRRDDHDEQLFIFFHLANSSHHFTENAHKCARAYTHTDNKSLVNPSRALSCQLTQNLTFPNRLYLLGWQHFNVWNGEKPISAIAWNSSTKNARERDLVSSISLYICAFCVVAERYYFYFCLLLNLSFSFPFYFTFLQNDDARCIVRFVCF